MDRKDGQPKTYVKAHKTKRKTAEAFMNILDKKPLDRITVQEVCDSADIHRSTFYKHFGSVFDIVSFITQEITDALMERAKVVDGGDQYFTFIADFYLKYRRALRNLYRTKYREMLIGQMGEIMEGYYLKVLQVMKSGEEPEVPLDWLAKYHAGGMLTMGTVLLDDRFNEEECREKLSMFYEYVLKKM